MNKRDFSQWVNAYNGAFQPVVEKRIVYLGDNDGVIDAGDPGDPSLVFVRDRSGNVGRVKRGTIANDTPAGVPFWVTDTEGVNGSDSGTISGVAAEQVDDYQNQSFQVAWVGVPTQIAFADLNGNITSVPGFVWNGVQLVIAGDDIGGSIILNLYSDTLSNNPFILGKSAGGTEALPTQTLTGKNLIRFSGSGYGATGFGASSTGALDFVAAEDFTDTAQGTAANLWTTPKGSTTKVIGATLQDDGMWLMRRGGAINRVQPTGTSITMPDGYCEIVSSYYTLQGTATLTLAGDAEMRII